MTTRSTTSAKSQDYRHDTLYNQAEDTAVVTTSGGNFEMYNGNLTISLSGNIFAGTGHDGAGAGRKATIDGGSTNLAAGELSFVGGGTALSGTGYKSVVIGGTDNEAAGYKSVVLGSNNTITQYSKKSSILGGEDNTIDSGNNLNTGYNVIVGGNLNQMTTLAGSFLHGCFIGGGSFNEIANSSSGIIAGGYLNTLSGASYSTIGGGYQNTVNELFGTIVGGSQAVVNAIGQQAYASGKFVTTGVDGDAQGSKYILRTTVGSSPSASVMTTNQATSAANNQIAIREKQAVSFSGLVVAKQDNSSNTAAWKVEGLAINFTGTTSVVSASATAIDNSPGWDLAIVADNSLNTVSFVFTGDGVNTINAVANIDTVEVMTQDGF